MAVGLYVHVPFCASRCGHCDFNTYAGLEDLVGEYMHALEWEMQGRAEEAPRIQTAYIGGGTPTHLPRETLEHLLRTISSTFQVHADAEFTVEMNPGDADEERLRRLREAGVNRMSMGAQAFDDRLLASLQRRHNSREAAEAVHAARRAGFTNISLDLMYAIPGQTMDDWKRTLEQAIALAPQHISTYSLTIEPGTPFARLQEQGLLDRPGHDEEADMYGLACATLKQAGYQHYEVSNFALPGRRCRHNEGYWRGEGYIGIGAGAHSYLRGVRWWNVKHPRDYIGLTEQGALPVAAAERLSVQSRMDESVMLGLRLSEGLSASAFRSRFGRDFREVYRTGVQQARCAGLARIAGDRLALTAAGAMLGDRVAVQIVGGGDD